MIVSTRESEQMRGRLLDLGISQISGASKTSVGGYTENVTKGSDQFELSDNRTLDEVVDWLIQKDHIPSFCTACYRKGRTGEVFMEMVKDVGIGNICQPNALVTLKEYGEDYANAKTKADIDALIQKEINTIPDKEVKETTKGNLEAVANGKRDLYL